MKITKCTICGEIIVNPVYRRFRRYVNFPAHADLTLCKENLMERNFQPLFEALYPFIQRVAEIPEECWHFLETDFFNPANTAENAVKFIDVFYDDYNPDDPTTWHGTQLWEDVANFIEKVFPVAQLIHPKPTDMRPINLKIPSTAFQKLLAYEIAENNGRSEPMWLSTTAKHMFDSFQTGKMPISDDFYDVTHLPSAKNSYLVFVPNELEDVLFDMGLGRTPRRYDAVFMTFSRMIPTLPANEELAFRVMKRKIAGSAAVKEAKRNRRVGKTLTVNYFKMPDLPKDKNRHLLKVLESRKNLQQAVHLAASLDGGQLSTFRCDPELRLLLKEVADAENIPLYKFITACLMVDDST